MIPLIEQTDVIEVPDNEVRVDVFRSSGPGGQSVADSQGAAITGWVLSPADALRVAVLKEGPFSNKTLTDDPRLLQGRPVFVNAKVPAGTAREATRLRS